jgi:GxxExxY protein
MQMYTFPPVCRITFLFFPGLRELLTTEDTEDTDVRDINSISYDIIGAAIKVHSSLGPGLLESIYEVCLIHELNKSGYRVESQKPIAVVYNGMQMKIGFRIDLLVDEQVIVEIKAVDNLVPVHTAQLMTYLKLTKLNLGLLINFNVVHLRNGIKRVIL